MVEILKKNEENPVLGEMTMNDFLQAFHEMKESKIHCGTVPLYCIDSD